MEINVKVPCIPGDEVYTVSETIIIKWRVVSINAEVITEKQSLIHLIIQSKASFGVLHYNFMSDKEPEDLYFTKEKAEEVVNKNFELFKNACDKVGKYIRDLEVRINDDI